MGQWIKPKSGAVSSLRPVASELLPPSKTVRILCLSDKVPALL